MTTCAVVQISDGLVVNKIVADPLDISPEDCVLIDATGLVVDIGWFWNGSSFIDPSPSEGA